MMRSTGAGTLQPRSTMAENVLYSWSAAALQEQRQCKKLSVLGMSY